MTNVKVDFKKAVAPLKCINAVNGSPVKKGRSQHLENFEEFKALNIPYSRNHDASLVYDYGLNHCVDVCKIFTNFDADPNDPANYDFFLTDKLIETTLEAGTETYYRLGEGIEHWDKKYDIMPPKDFKKWAVICEHIIAHYNEGWADGFHYNIKYWEIWNEPETEEGQELITQNTWGGNTEQFFELFATAATHLKNRFPDIKIGGPALCWLHEWGERFCKYMKEHNVPLDFYSWHIYTNKVWKLRADAENVRRYLDEAGYPDCESHCNEWNYVKSWWSGFADTLVDVAGITGAAFVAAMMIEAQHCPVDMMMYYDMRVHSGFNGVFDAVTLRPHKKYYTFLAISKLMALKTECASESDDSDVYTLAAANENGKAGVIVYYTHEDELAEKQVTVDISGAGDNFEFTLLSEDKTFEKMENIKVVNGKATFTLPPQSLLYYEEIK